MKKLLFLLLLCFAVGVQNLQAQGLKIDENTIIKNAEGKRINMATFSTMVNSGDWMIIQKKDSDGQEFIQLIKSTKEQKMRMLQMLEKQTSTSNMKGKKAADFAMTDINGNPITSENTKNKVVVLNFWFIACKPCINEIPELNEVYEKFKDNKNVVFASITFDKKEKVERFLKKKPIRYPVVSDNRETIGAYGVQGYPTNIVIGKDGTFVDHITGGFGGIGKKIEASIEAALKG